MPPQLRLHKNIQSMLELRLHHELSQGNPAQENWEKPARHHFRQPGAGSGSAPDPKPKVNGAAPNTDRRTTSEYIKPATAPSKSTYLQGEERIRRRAFYLGNVDTGYAADSIVQWCTEGGVEVLTCKVSEIRYFRFA